VGVLCSFLVVLLSLTMNFGTEGISSKLTKEKKRKKKEKEKKVSEN